MKRYRVLCLDFDSRAITLDVIPDDWEEHIKELHRANQARTIAKLKLQFGEIDFEKKLKNFKDLGAKPFSVIAFHNRFLTQIRNAFSHGEYYPALTGVCALGERVLNHLIIGLREHYKDDELYKKVYRKDSFDHWPTAIDALTKWGVLTTEADAAFRDLAEKRNRALHFNPETDTNDRELALDAIKTFEVMLMHQFSSFGVLPWLLVSPGECYIKQEWEQSPFVQLVYLPNCAYVGYKHLVTNVIPWQLEDASDYLEVLISDDEFVRLRQAHQAVEK
jgi:hypothetical protein